MPSYSLSKSFLGCPQDGEHQCCPMCTMDGPGFCCSDNLAVIRRQINTLLSCTYTLQVHRPQQSRTSKVGLGLSHFLEHGPESLLSQWNLNVLASWAKSPGWRKAKGFLWYFQVFFDSTEPINKCWLAGRMTSSHVSCRMCFSWRERKKMISASQR